MLPPLVAMDMPSIEDETRQWFRDNRADIQRLTFEELPQLVRKDVNDYLDKFVEGSSSLLRQEIQRCFASEITELSRVGANGSLSLALEQDEPSVRLLYEFARSEFVLRDKKWNMSGPVFRGASRRWLRSELLTANVAVGITSRLFGFFFSSCYYFPAARSGILQGHKALASFILSRLPLVGIEDFEVPRLSGVVADFIGNLLRLEARRTPTPISEVAKFIEKEICKGEIALKAGDQRVEYPEIYYQHQEQRVPLHRTSSMISEIAPVVLFLKHVVEKGDLLIIEEPEAHLHPDNQRTLARAIVRLIRNDVRVLVTTHSDYFVNQISNFVRLAHAKQAREKLRYEESEFIEAGEVGAYLFKMDRSGESEIEELEVTENDGIPELEFTRIAEQLYDETAVLDNAGWNRK